MNIADRLQAMLAVKGLSMRQMSRDTGWSYGATRSYCVNEKEPPIAFVRDVASTYDVDPGWVAFGDS